MTAKEEKCFRPLTNDANGNTSSHRLSHNVITSKKRYIKVSEVGRVVCPPDRAKLVISCESVKDSPDTAIESVGRRINYILQTLKANQVKQSSITVHESLVNANESYKALREVDAVLTNFNIAEKVANLLIQKLGQSIYVAPIQFYHSVESLENARRQASINAIRNAKIKALTMAQYLNQVLGPCITIEEEDTTELITSIYDDNYDEQSILRKIQSKTVDITTKVSVEFSIKHHTVK